MTEINPSYVNHIGSTLDGDGNIFAVITQDGPSSGDTDVIIKRCLATADPSLADSWKEVKRWTEKIDGKPGYGSAEVRRDGLFVAILSQRNAAAQTVAMVRTMSGIASPWPPSTGGGAAYVPAPGGVIQLFNRSQFSGEQRVALAPYPIPAGVTLDLRVSVTAEQPWRFGRVAAPDAAGHIELGATLFVITQAPGVRIVAYGSMTPAPDHTIVVMADQGVVDMTVDVRGWWYG